MKAVYLCMFFVDLFIQGIYQPSNDEPCNAIEIPVGPADFLGNPCNPSQNYLWNAATLTPATPNPTCVVVSQSSNIRDVWYKMKVPSSGAIRFTINSDKGLFWVVYRGNCDSSLFFTAVNCSFYTAPFGNKETKLTGLTVGTTIYIRLMRTTEMANTSGNAFICASETVPDVAIDNLKRVGIGTNQPLAKLDVAGTAIIRDSLQVGKSLEVRGAFKTDSLVIPNGAALDHVLISDAVGNASWSSKIGVIYSSGWLNASSYTADTTIDGTCLKVRYLNAPELTSTILNTKLITVYFKIMTIGPYQLPYINDAGGVTNQINCIFDVGRIIVYRHTFNNCRFNSGIAVAFPNQPLMVSLPQALQYRYVIHN